MRIVLAALLSVQRSSMARRAATTATTSTNTVSTIVAVSAAHAATGTLGLGLGALFAAVTFATGEFLAPAADRTGQAAQTAQAGEHAGGGALLLLWGQKLRFGGVGGGDEKTYAQGQHAHGQGAQHQQAQVVDDGLQQVEQADFVVFGELGDGVGHLVSLSFPGLTGESMDPRVKPEDDIEGFQDGKRQP